MIPFIEQLSINITKTELMVAFISSYAIHYSKVINCNLLFTVHHDECLQGSDTITTIPRNAYLYICMNSFDLLDVSSNYSFELETFSLQWITFNRFVT